MVLVILLSVLYLLITVIVLLFIFRKLIVGQYGKLLRNDEENVRNKIVIITGANSGIGLATAKELAQRSATVILACRNINSAKEAIVDIRRTTFFGKLYPMELDLSSMKSVREFVQNFQEKFDKLDILILNGGVLIPTNERHYTNDGFEMHMGVNYLSNFLLTNLLLPFLKNSDYSRIVSVGSLLIKTAKLDFEDLMAENVKFGKDDNVAKNLLYSNSKMALALFNLQLGEVILKGTNVHCYYVDCGVALTNIDRNVNTLYPKILVSIGYPIRRLLFRTSAQGAVNVLYCALSKQCSNKSGKIYRNCKIWEKNDFLFPDDLIVKEPLKPLNSSDAKKLYEISSKLTFI